MVLAEAREEAETTETFLVLVLAEVWEEAETTVTFLVLAEVREEACLHLHLACLHLQLAALAMEEAG